jgi:hypothetical protein
MRPDLVTVLTDETGPVEVYDIKRAVRRIVDRAGVEQLVIYFAGHGVNIKYGEYWLLSHAPEDSQAAVNVESSIVLARRCGIPHVVLISDACRTAAEGIEAQQVSGSEIFPNTGLDGPERDVDVFFASTLGKPAYEVKDPATTAGRFRALYTDALTDALTGQDTSVLDRHQEGQELFGLIRPRPLKKHLQADMARRLRALRLPPGTNQIPDARITSGDDVWLSKIPMPYGWPREGTRGPRPADFVDDSQPALSQAFLQQALDIGPGALDAVRRGPAWPPLREAMDRRLPSFGPRHFETRCGFKVRGTTIDEVCAAHAEAEVLGPGHDLVRVTPEPEGAGQVLLRFADGNGAVLPVIPGFIAELTYRDGELADVVYEPSNGSQRWRDFQQRAAELRALRALIASAAEFGVFRLESDDAPLLARKMRSFKSLDPALALFAAYAYHDLRDRDRIRAMGDSLAGDLGGVRLFDITMLSGFPVTRAVPFVPMLSQGWPLMRAFGASPRLADLERHTLSSLWTLFDPRGVSKAGEAIRRGEI